jgi:hypothetical protein
VFLLPFWYSFYFSAIPFHHTFSPEKSQKKQKQERPTTVVVAVGLQIDCTYIKTLQISPSSWKGLHPRTNSLAPNLTSHLFPCNLTSTNTNIYLPSLTDYSLCPMTPHIDQTFHQIIQRPIQASSKTNNNNKNKIINLPPQPTIHEHTVIINRCSKPKLPKPPIAVKGNYSHVK